MINHLHIQNFKCLLDVDIDLAPFTILIGPNDSGKSSLLEAIYLLGRTTHEPWNQVFSGNLALETLVARRDTNRDISWHIQGRTQERSFAYALSLSPRSDCTAAEEIAIDGQVVLRRSDDPDGGYLSFGNGEQIGGRRDIPRFQTALSTTESFMLLHLPSIAESLASTEKYALDPDDLRATVPPSSEPVLTPKGDNLAAVLESLFTGPDPSVRTNLERSLSEAVPTLRGIFLPTVEGGLKSLDFVLSDHNRSRIVIPARLASDGALLLTAFLALAYGNTPEILLVEEPENGLHPSRLKLVIDLLRKISTGEVGNRPRQVIVTTHSPTLLNFARPEEVRIFTREPHPGTQVIPMTNIPDIQTLLKEFAVGELWYMLGENGLLKGQPA